MGDIVDVGSIPGSRRFPRGGHGNPLQYSCLENPMDRGAWWDTVHGVAKNQTRLSDFTYSLTKVASKYSETERDTHTETDSKRRAQPLEQGRN